MYRSDMTPTVTTPATPPSIAVSDTAQAEAQPPALVLPRPSAMPPPSAQPPPSEPANETPYVVSGFSRTTTGPPKGGRHSDSYPGSSAAAPPPRRSSLGWIESSVGVMVMPLTFAIVAMIAPVLWIFGSRARR